MLAWRRVLAEGFLKHPEMESWQQTCMRCLLMAGLVRSYLQSFSHWPPELHGYF